MDTPHSGPGLTGVGQNGAGLIWGRLSSSNVQKVLWLLAELGIAYERRDAGNDFGVVDTPGYRALNPNGLVPTLVQDDFVLWESNAILRYLAATHPGGADFYPQAPRERARVDQFLDWQLAMVTPPHTVVYRQIVRTPAAARDTAAVEKSLAAFTAAWRVAESALERHDFIAGPTLSLADIALGPYVHRWFALPIERPGLPALRAWYDRLLARPAYMTHVAVALT